MFKILLFILLFFNLLYSSVDYDIENFNIENSPELFRPCIEKEKGLFYTRAMDVGYIGGINEASYCFVLMRNFYKKWGLLDYLKSPYKMRQDACRRSYSETCLSNVTSKKKNPKIFQAVWITNTESPKAIAIDELNNFFDQADKLEGYENIIWTNIEPNEFRNINKLGLQDKNVSIKRISSLKTKHLKLLDFVLSPCKYLPNNAIVNNTFNGLIIDLSKYLILESNGGTLADFNFYFSDVFKPEILNDFNFMACNSRGFILENGFFSSARSHIILNGLLGMIYDLLIDDSDDGINQLRKFMFKKVDNVSIITTFFSMEPLMIAYLKYNNLSGNNDVLTGFNSISIDNHKSTLEIEHDAMAYKLESTNLQDISDYLTDYQNILKKYAGVGLFICNDDLIDADLIGMDVQATTWCNADIFHKKP